MDFLPTSNEAEMAVLGSVIIDPNSIYKILDYLDVQDFYKQAHATLYQTILKMFQGGKTIELLTLSQELSDAGKLSEIGGNSYLAALTNSITTSSSIRSHAEKVKDKSIRRKLIRTQDLNLSVIGNEEKDIDSVLAETQGNILKITHLGEADDSTTSILRELDAVHAEYLKKYEKGQKLLGVSCGFEKIDDIIDGLRPGHVWVVGGFTSTGKTQFALNIVHSVIEQNVPVSIISLEMSRIDTLARIMGIRHNLSSAKIIKGKHEPDVKDSFEEAKQFLAQAPLEVHTTYFDLEKIKMLIRRDVYTKKVKLVVVDYVQNIISEKGLREYDLLTQAATDLQALARELQVSIYIVSQISNEAEKGSGAGAGFKGTGALEAVADLAIRLKRDKTKEAPQELAVPVDIVVTKNRHGYTGKIEDYQMWLKSGKFDFRPNYGISEKNAPLPKVPWKTPQYSQGDN